MEAGHVNLSRAQLCGPLSNAAFGALDKSISFSNSEYFFLKALSRSSTPRFSSSCTLCKLCSLIHYKHATLLMLIQCINPNPNTKHVTLLMQI